MNIFAWDFCQSGAARRAIPMVVGVLIVAAMARATTFADLNVDWSAASNPNPGPFGTWEYVEGNNPLPFVDQWVGFPELSGWGPLANHPGNFLPFFSKAQVAFLEIRQGDVNVHTTDQFNGSSNGSAAFRWTSGIAQSVRIQGELWPGRLIDRANTFVLTLFHGGNSIPLAGGFLSGSGSVTRCNPARIDVAQVELAIGDVLELRIAPSPLSSPGEFVCVNLRVTTDDCPGRRGDLDSSGLVDGDDVAHFVNCLLTGMSDCGNCACADMNADGATTIDDLPLFVARVL